MHAAVLRAGTAFDERRASIAFSMRALGETGMRFCGGRALAANIARDARWRFFPADMSADRGVNVTAGGAFLQR